ncbi:ribonuclease HII [Chondrinema litorale]|uniref:ribonuclease HII n=1 Tax=Chondrinema litorale TaxID=2994555 RepID=UPI002544ACCA|nr:ribonuclease HII [Chondrinema litorale]UZR94131.1 ribonuclease HII [Chondrinema litorale]
MILQAYLEKGKIEAGLDEAGRGSLAGPVVAAAVILPEEFDLPGLRDSKKLSYRQRNKLRELIKEQAIAWAVGEASPKEIDQINISQATFLAMHRALKKIKQPAIDHLLVDGLYFKAYKKIPHHCIVKGDSKMAAIASASILAKTHRDDKMIKLAKKFTEYGWDHNVGYPTLEHRSAIERFGVTDWHRRSFKMLADK